MNGLPVILLVWLASKDTDNLTLLIKQKMRGSGCIFSTNWEGVEEHKPAIPVKGHQVKPAYSFLLSEVLLWQALYMLAYPGRQGDSGVRQHVVIA
jgi:hypothetical protein